VSGFAEQAQRILETAADAAAHGEPCAEMTILIGAEGGIRLCADSDWPLDSLAMHHGARAAYRVTGRGGSVRVEGREGNRTCVLESSAPARVARLLLGGR
jgi:hypothetical protein